MITATSGLNLNHGWVRGYRFMAAVAPRPIPIEYAENTGRVLLYLLDNTVEFTNIVYSPMADLLLDGQASIVDDGNHQITITANGESKTIVFDAEDEDFYSILASNPLIIEKEFGHANNSTSATLGWKWNGETFHQ